MTKYDAGRVHEGSVLLAGHIPGAGLTFFRSEAEALKWALDPHGSPQRRVIRFQVAHLTELKAVVPPGPYLEEA